MSAASLQRPLSPVPRVAVFNRFDYSYKWKYGDRARMETSTTRPNWGRVTPTNHAHGVLHVIVDATGNNSLYAFLIIFTDLIGRCLAWDSRSRLHLTFWSFFFFLIKSNYLLYPTINLGFHPVTSGICFSVVPASCQLGFVTMLRFVKYI